MTETVYAVDVRNMRDGIHNLFLTDSDVDVERINNIAEALVKTDNDVDEDAMYHLLSNIEVLGVVEVNHRNITTDRQYYHEMYGNVVIVNNHHHDLYL